MVGRSLILIAAFAGMAIVNAAALSPSVADPYAKTQQQEVESTAHPITPPPTLPDIPPLLPGRPPAGLPHYPGVAADPGQFAPLRNTGPVTGYGPGGMASVPGAPANPPYSSGPLR